MALDWPEIKKYVDGYVTYKNAYEQLMANVRTLDCLLHSGHGMRSQKSVDAVKAFIVAAKFVQEQVDRRDDNGN